VLGMTLGSRNAEAGGRGAEDRLQAA
jgi:hypothetical protein